MAARGKRSPSCQILGEPNALRRVRQVAVQEQVGDFLERGIRSQVLDGVSRDGQPARLPIDLTESRRCGHDALQPLSHTVQV